MNMVEEIITASNSSTTPIHRMDALLLAAIDDTIHLDGVYFLLRRQPDVVLTQLRRQSGLSAIDDDNEDDKIDRRSDTDKDCIYVENQEADDNDDSHNDRDGPNNIKATTTDNRKRKWSTYGYTHVEAWHICFEFSFVLSNHSINSLLVQNIPT